jgi:phosphoglycerol transferase
MSRASRPALRFCAYLAAFCGLGLAYWLRQTFGDVTMEQALWHLRYADQAAFMLSQVFFVECAVQVLLVPALLATGATLLHSWAAPRLAGWRRKALRAAPAAIGAGALGALALQFSLASYAAAYLAPDRFAHEYVEPRSVALEQQQRRNLVLVYAESLEATYGDATLFGRDLLAPLHRAGGHSYARYQEAAGATWTIAGMVATQCGVPLKVYAQADLRAEGPGKAFLAGATCLGDVLQAHGYRNVFLGGAPLSFSGKGRFLKDHGYQEAWGREEWVRAGARPGELQAWGLYDDALFARARKRLAELHAAGQPFNLTLLTLDTHNPFGFMSSTCRERGATGFEGIVSCSARQIADLIAFARERGYLEDTAVVVVGDHLAVPNPVWGQLEAAGERRSIFNLFVGKDLPPPNTTEFLPFDLFPTLLELAGIRVPGDRLALGYSAVGTREAQRPAAPDRDWSLAVVRGSPRYDALWHPIGPGDD